ncbi:MAG TPA: IS21 family transposase [Armatimonadota bacterium]
MRFETAPGHQAQVDWAYIGADEEGKLYAFVLVLSFSRLLYLEFTRSMDLPTLITCHQRAFSFLGGVPSTLLYHNTAQVKRPQGGLHPLFADFSAHYGFAVRTHRPYRPRTKGKVERRVDCLKDNFLRGRSFAGLQDLSQQGRLWLEQANRRVHATTGERPLDLLPREGLSPLSEIPPYLLCLRHSRRADAEGFVHLASVRYSVPPQYVGQPVVVVQQEQRVQVKLGDLVLAEHPRGAPGASVATAEHVTALWQQTL